MERGTSISPVTLKPKAGFMGGPNREKEREGYLREQAAEVGISETEAGEKLLFMIRDLLYVRLDALIVNDPEALSYRNILVKLGYKEDVARQAVNELEKRYVKR